ncbi:MAG: hypothetical protein QXL15_04640 [Candidatus Korarchaeota archaeon]
MNRKPLPSFPCPKCNELIKTKFVDVDEAQKLYNETSKPVPVIVTCPKNHVVIAYIYFLEGKIALRERIYALSGDVSEADWFNI